MARIEFGMSMPKQRAVLALIIERDRIIAETNEALAALAESFSAGLSVPTGGRWSFWRDAAGQIALVYDHEDAQDQAPESSPSAGPGSAPPTP